MSAVTVDVLAEQVEEIDAALKYALRAILHGIDTVDDLQLVLGLDEGAASLWLVEWPQRAGAALPPADLRIDLAIDGHGRSAQLSACSQAGKAWLAAI